VIFLILQFSISADHIRPSFGLGHDTTYVINVIRDSETLKYDSTSDFSTSNYVTN